MSKPLQTTRSNGYIPIATAVVRGNGYIPIATAIVRGNGYIPKQRLYSDRTIYRAARLGLALLRQPQWRNAPCNAPNATWQVPRGERRASPSGAHGRARCARRARAALGAKTTMQQYNADCNLNCLNPPRHMQHAKHNAQCASDAPSGELRRRAPVGELRSACSGQSGSCCRSACAGALRCA